MTLNNAQKTASSSGVKTSLGKTFAGSPVNACSVEPESVLKKLNLIKMSTLYAPASAGIPHRPYFKDLSLF